MTAFDEYETICPFCGEEFLVRTAWWMDGERRGPTLDFSPPLLLSEFLLQLKSKGGWADIVERYGLPDEVDIVCEYCDDYYTLEDLRVG